MSRVFTGNRGEIVNPIDDICERGQDEKKSEEDEGEAVKIGARETADAHAGIYAAADKPRDGGYRIQSPAATMSKSTAGA